MIFLSLVCLCVSLPTCPQGWLLCEDQACGYRSRLVSVCLGESGPSCPNCRQGKLLEEVSQFGCNYIISINAGCIIGSGHWVCLLCIIGGPRLTLALTKTTCKKFLCLLKWASHFSLSLPLSLMQYPAKALYRQLSAFNLLFTGSKTNSTSRTGRYLPACPPSLPPSTPSPLT